MSHTRWFRAFGLALISLLFSLTTDAQYGVAKTGKGGGNTAGQASGAQGTSIQDALLSQFRLTRTTADLTDIVTAGDVVTIHKGNLVMFAGTAVPSTNNYKYGSIGQGFGTALIMANPNTIQRMFVPEEKCWVTGIQVQKDGVLFHLFSDPYNGLRYYGDLKVLFPIKKVVPDVDSFMQTIAEVLTVDERNDGPRMQGMPGPRQQTPSYTPDPASEPMPDVAPPPTPPMVIEPGQTVEQVITSFGQPLRIARFGEKEIYFYKDMKVTFTNGKVSNVE